jgi:uncharacterized glyoxalase superfamily protein PhnB
MLHIQIRRLAIGISVALVILVAIAAWLRVASAQPLFAPEPTIDVSVTAMKKLTPVLYVEEIEPVLPFWIDRLGFTKTIEVPQGDRLGFVALEHGSVEIMYQTRTSVENDVPELASSPLGGSFLFIEVEDLDAIERALSGIEPVVPRRTTFYGADELIVREPGGHVVTFAQFGTE